MCGTSHHPPTPTLSSLSLSLFEALRGLRDSVAPESQSGNNNNDNNNIPRKSPIDLNLDMDYDDFLLAYNRDDPVALEFIQMANNKAPKTREDYTKLRAKFAIKRASELMSKLSDNILTLGIGIDSPTQKAEGRLISDIAF